MNYTELQHITRHLNFTLNQAVIEQISDGNCKLQLGFHKHSDCSDNRRYFIILDFRASHLDIYPTRYPKKAPAVPQAFTMLLRKYLSGLHVIAVRLAADDRIIFIEFGQNDEIQFSIIAEFTGCNPKIFLIDAENQQILGLIGEDEIRTIHSEYTRPEPHLIKLGTDKYASLNGTEYEQQLDSDYTSRDTYVLSSDTATGGTKVSVKSPRSVTSLTFGLKVNTSDDADLLGWIITDSPIAKQS